MERVTVLRGLAGGAVDCEIIVQESGEKFIHFKVRGKQRTMPPLAKTEIETVWKEVQGG